MFVTSQLLFCRTLIWWLWINAKSLEFCSSYSNTSWHVEISFQNYFYKELLFQDILILYSLGIPHLILINRSTELLLK